MRKFVLTVGLAAGLLVIVGCSSSGGSPSASSSAAASSSGGLTGKTWQLTATTTKVPAHQGVVTDSQNYTIEFKSDGTFNAKADCNNVSGTYTVVGPALTITPGPTTLVQCPPESLSDVYIATLGNAASWAVADSQLTITTKDEATLTYK